MTYKIGKIVEFDGYNGRIVTETQEYYFIRDDIEENVRIEKGDIVKFQGKGEDIFPQAYYITKIEK